MTMSDPSTDDNERPEVPEWRGRKAVLSHVTYSRSGEQFEEGDEIGVLFHDRGLVCTVEEVVTEERSDDADTDRSAGDDDE